MLLEKKQNHKAQETKEENVVFKGFGLESFFELMILANTAASVRSRSYR